MGYLGLTVQINYLCMWKLIWNLHKITYPCTKRYGIMCFIWKYVC